MPTYDYECGACGHSFEKYQSITAPAVKKCPECGKLKVRRMLGTGAGIIFKGSGFYQTDYRSSSYQEAAKKDKPDTSNASSEGSGKADNSAKASKDSSSKASTPEKK